MAAKARQIKPEIKQQNVYVPYKQSDSFSQLKTAWKWFILHSAYIKPLQVPRNGSNMQLPRKTDTYPTGFQLQTVNRKESS